jgi:hypothetical protein
LNQELSAIESMNQWLGKLNAASRRKYKHVTILRMQLDEAAVQRFAGCTLDVPSKMYRGREFVLGLMAHGGDQARAFLPIARQKARLRHLVERGWNDLMHGTLADVRAAAAFDTSHVLVSFSNATAAGSDRTILTGPAGVQEFIKKLHADCLSYLPDTQAPASAQTSVIPSVYVTIDDLIVEARSEAAYPEEFLAACR